MNEAMHIARRIIAEEEAKQGRRYCGGCRHWRPKIAGKDVGFCTNEECPTLVSNDRSPACRLFEAKEGQG